MQVMNIISHMREGYTCHEIDTARAPHRSPGRTVHKKGTTAASCLRHPKQGIHQFLRQAHRFQPVSGLGGRSALVQQLVTGGCHQFERALVSRLQHPRVKPALTDLALDCLNGIDGVAWAAGFE